MNRTLASLALACLFAAVTPAHAQYASSSGMYFSSAGAAYMNTLYWNRMSMSPKMRRAMEEAEAKANGKSGQATTPKQPAATQSAPPLSVTNLNPMPEERAKVLDVVVAKVPAAEREAHRARMEALMASVENSLGNNKNNLATITYLLIGTCLQISTGHPIETARAQDVIRAVNTAYATDPRFTRLDNRQRSQMYYLFTITLGTTATMGLSKNPAEAQAGKAMAESTLRAFGIPV